jgi:hypothetical protein
MKTNGQSYGLTPFPACLKLAALTSMCAMLCSCGPKEQGGGPVADGHPLDHWLVIMVDKTQANSVPQAERAIRRLGTNAISYCLASLSLVEQAKATRSAEKLIMAQNLSGGASKALELLGTEVKPSLPELTKLAHRADPDTVRLSAGILARLGSDGVSAMITGITNATLESRDAVVDQLGGCGTNLLPHMPFLLDNLGALDRLHSALCCTVLAMELGSKTNLTSSFVSLLRSRDPIVRFGAVNGLQTLGTNAIQAQALPALMELKTDSDEYNADAAKNAIWVISGKEE